MSLATVIICESLLVPPIPSSICSQRLGKTKRTNTVRVLSPAKRPVKALILSLHCWWLVTCVCSRAAKDYQCTVNLSQYKVSAVLYATMAAAHRYTWLLPCTMAEVLKWVQRNYTLCQVKQSWWNQLL